MIEHKEDLSDQAMADWYKETVKQVREGKLTIDFIPVMLYGWKDGKGEIRVTASEKKGYLNQAVSYRYSALAGNADTPEGAKIFNEFCEMQKTGEFTGRYVSELTDLAKKMILSDIILKEDITAQ